MANLSRTELSLAFKITEGDYPFDFSYLHH